MISKDIASYRHEFQGRLIRSPDEPISWAGECPWNTGLCFGLENGKLWITDLDSPSGFEPLPLVDAGEAINGIAFVGDLVAASTRNEVVFCKVDLPTGRGVRLATFEGGAHGIHATSQGGFVAPLGVEGLLLVKPDADKTYSSRVVSPSGRTINVYKLGYIGLSERGDIFVGAGRRNGMLTLALPPGKGTGSLGTRHFRGLDVVDVCSLSASEWPLSAAGLGLDRSIHLIRNVLEDRRPQTLSLQGLQGIAYSILCAQGHIVILTSQGIYVLPNLAKRFLDDDPIDGLMTVNWMPYLAVDMYLAYDRWLLVVMPDHVVSMPIEQVATAESHSPVNIPTTIIEAAWEPEENLELAVVDVP